MHTSRNTTINRFTSTISSIAHELTLKSLNNNNNDDNDTSANMLINTLSIATIIAIFWPLIINIIFAVMAASGWLFWILLSLISSLFQLVYVAYQFVRISLDVVVLVILKSYARGRFNFLYYFDSWFGCWRRCCWFRQSSSSSDVRDALERPGRRREWRKKLSSADDYKDFEAIPIEEPVMTNGNVQVTTRNNKAQATTSPDSSASRSSTPTNNINNASVNTSSTAKKSQEKTTIETTCEMIRNTTNRLRETRLEAQSKEIRQRDKNNNDSDDPPSSLSSSSASSTRASSSSSSLKFLLSGVIKRNHLNIEDIMIDDSRSVAESGRHCISREARRDLNGYLDEAESCLDYLARSTADDGSSPEEDDDDEEMTDRMELLRQLQQNTGCTALMFSGGGAQTMNHLGTLRALIESGVYDGISVISGTSGGSTAAGMCAILTADELFHNFCIPTVSTDYKLTGEMSRDNIRWFPTLFEMATYWVKNKLLIDSHEIKKCCDFYFGNVTFREAYRRTGKHVSISVSASRANTGTGGGGGGSRCQRLLLNHVSTPHVTIASAVAASCALPGVISPRKLETKDGMGRLEPFEVDGAEWIDGSVQADLPFRRLATLFNVSNFIVSQVNFHVIPFLNKPHHPDKNSFYWRLFQMYEWDIRNRVLNLSRMGLFPSFFGQDVSKVFKQKYHGHLTIVPRFTGMQLFGLKVLENPGVEDMKFYLKNGQMATWPHVETIKTMLRLEIAIRRSIDVLENRMKNNAMTSKFVKPSSDRNSNFSTSMMPKVVSSGDKRQCDDDTSNEKTQELKAENSSLRNEVRLLKNRIELLEKRLIEDSGNDEKKLD